MKNKVRGKLRKDKAKNTAKHGAVRGDRGIGERQGTAKIEKEVSNLGHRGTRHRMVMPMTPGTVYYPLSLVVDTGEAASAVGKLTSHHVREAGLTRGSPEIRNAVS